MDNILDFNLENFRCYIPYSVRNNMLHVAKAINDDFIADQSGDCCTGDGRIAEISGNSYDGFISFQSGGYDVSCCYCNGYGSGTYFSNDESEFTDKIIEDAAHNYRSDNDIQADAELSEDERELEYEYIDSWLEDQATILGAEMWCGHRDDKRDDLVTFRLYLSYRDAPYHRVKYAEDIAEFQLTFEELNNTKPSDIVARLQAALDNHN